MNVIYRDSEGYETIGIGHLVDKRKGGSLPSWAWEELEKNKFLSEKTIYSIFDTDLKEKKESFERGIPWVKDLDVIRYCALLDMCFQMGLGSEKTGQGLLGFKNTLRLIKEGNYLAASENMLKSKWAKQTPNRAKRRSEEIKTGVPARY